MKNAIVTIRMDEKTLEALDALVLTERKRGVVSDRSVVVRGLIMKGKKR